MLDLAREHRAILLTEDSDFGEWVFAYKKDFVNVIFLRYKASEIEQITQSLLGVLESRQLLLPNRFVVITPRKIRARRL